MKKTLVTILSVLSLAGAMTAIAPMPAHALSLKVQNDSLARSIVVLNGNRGAVTIPPKESRGFASGPASRALRVDHGYRYSKDGATNWASACISATSFKDFGWQDHYR